MRRFTYLLIVLPLFAKSQIVKINDKEIDPDKSKICKDIFRVSISASTDTKFSVAGNYEREIFKAFTFFIKAGPAYNRQYDSTDAFGNKQYEWIFNVIGAAEIRYYFNLHRRNRLQKTTKNFTACYLSIEELLRSSPVFILNKSGKEHIAGSNAPFINIGYQHQFKQTYYHIFFGTRFPGDIYAHTVSVLDLLHGGISIGLVF